MPHDSSDLAAAPLSVASGGNHETPGETIAAPDLSLPGELNRWATLIATGDVSFPTDLSTDATIQLAAAVREQRRVQLVQFVARQIAWDIQADQEPYP